MKMLNFFILIFTQIIFVLDAKVSDLFFPMDRNCLVDLPMSGLLKLKRSVEELTCHHESNPDIDLIKAREDNSETPLSQNHIALPLIGKTKTRSYEYQGHELWKDHHPTKIQTVFQVSITALSFLAFGGYLLCMIVQAIKSKGTTYLHNLTGGNNTGGTISTLKKIKIYQRARRDLRKKSNFSKTNGIEVLASPTPEELFNILIFVTEGYVKIAGLK